MVSRSAAALVTVDVTDAERPQVLGVLLTRNGRERKATVMR